ncbi:MAG: hypothetical protein ISR77_28930 [Pirellulaceae bacterium]|nr:hypothetical protein [Pirellulaceae bacterium]
MWLVKPAALIAVVFVASGCGTTALNQEASSATQLAKRDVAEWTPSYVRKRLGDPIGKRRSLKHSYLLQYDGIGFLYAAPDNVESDQFEAVIFEKSDLPNGTSEFMKVVPHGLTIGCTPTTSKSILGEPEEVEEGDDIVWHTYNRRKGDWRKYWLRFRDGELDLINISLHYHGDS